MAITSKRLSGPTQLSTSDDTKYTVPANTNTRNISYQMHSLAPGPLLVTINHVLAGNTPDATTIMFEDTIQGGAVIQWQAVGTLGPGDFITAACSSAGNVNLQIGGDEVV